MSSTIAEALQKALSAPTVEMCQAGQAESVMELPETPVEDRKLSLSVGREKRAAALVMEVHELARRYASKVAKQIVRRLRYQMPEYLGWAERCQCVSDFLHLRLYGELQTYKVSSDHQDYAFQLVASHFVEELGWLEKEGRL